MKKLRVEGTYLLDNNYLLYLWIVKEGIGYRCFTKTGEEVGNGVVDNILDNFTSPSEKWFWQKILEQELGLQWNSVAIVSDHMLEEIQKGRALLKEFQLFRELQGGTDPKSIRFIDSAYHNLFWLPDNGTIQIKSINNVFVEKCSYIDSYHVEVGQSVYHICQFAEILEKMGASCMPEPLILEEAAAWEVNGKGYLSLQTCEDGYDYTLYDKTYNEVDGGQLDDPSLSINKVRDDILKEFGWDRRSLYPIDYDVLQEHVE